MCQRLALVAVEQDDVARLFGRAAVYPPFETATRSAHAGVCQRFCHPSNPRPIATPMIRIAITPAAYEAIIATLPQGAPLWPVQRQGGQCLVHVEAAVVDRLRAMRGPGEDYSDVILRLTQLEASGT